jgi:hypothetical protein
MGKARGGAFAGWGEAADSVESSSPAGALVGVADGGLSLVAVGSDTIAKGVVDGVGSTALGSGGGGLAPLS